MIIKCKVADGNCPQGLDICCAICDSKANCDKCCDSQTVDIYQCCPDAEVINTELTAFQSAVPEAIEKITNLIQFKKELDEQEKQLKQMLVEAMEQYGVKSFETDLIKMVYVAPTTRSTIDSTRLKKDHPDIVDQYTKTSDVAASVRVTLKGGGK
jgi:hypothetical protein